MDPAQYPVSAFGRARRTPGRHGYTYFEPARLPRHLPISPPVQRLLSEADAALGRLAGVGLLIGNPRLLARPLALRDAVASTRIEGTRTSMQEVLEFQATDGRPSPDIQEVVDALDALEWGLAELHRLPMSTRLLRGMHARLLAGERGHDRAPGELRRTQNWIGGAGSSIETASFVPPPPDALGPLLDDWEAFANADLDMPLLIQDALLHYQFETLHPFLDGNGRLGRLVIVLFLVDRGRLPGPLLHVSPFLERHRQRYYAALDAPRISGDVEPWLTLFLEAVRTSADEAVGRAQHLVALRGILRVATRPIRSVHAPALADLMLEAPILTARVVQHRLGVTRPTALTLLRALADLDLVRALPPGPRNRQIFAAHQVLTALVADLPPFTGSAP